jgi:serine/threonine-protein kinase
VFPGEQPPPALSGFEILQRLGAGGVGQVFLAKSKGGRLVAIKVLADGQKESDEAITREASLCARLQHPSIVQVRALLEDRDFAALVFEYVPGVALARLLRFCSASAVRLPDNAAWHIVERVLAALAYAHSFKDEHGQPTPIVHRDVSPANVLVDWTGGVKLTDFGIAKMIGVSPATRAGLVKGTLGCMAPEQARGDRVTERADVYAAGLLAWRLATGRIPFAKHAKDEFELLRAMRNPRIKPLSVIRPDLPEPLLEAIAAALEPEAEERSITAAELGAKVRASVDVEAGRVELATLLDRWRAGLEKTVRRAEDDSSNQRTAHTLRYEEVALAFDDDDVPADGPTFEAHALPSEAAILAAVPSGPDEAPEPLPPMRPQEMSSPPPPPAEIPPLVASRVSPAETTRPPARRRRWIAAALLPVAFLLILAAFLLSRR